ncbi:MAG: hypothetical protein Q8O03_03375 [Nanoarchaeota archaeon]|nr:hypothetical protein [Nanoarchaeota archaeon]
MLIILLMMPVVFSEGFEVNPLFLNMVTKTGVSAEEFVTVKNLGLDTVSVQVTTNDANFKLSSYGFGLLPGEEKPLDFKFYNNLPGVYANEFFFRAEGITKVLPIVVEVETPTVRFDSTVETLEAKNVFYPGDGVGFSFTVFDLLEFTSTSVEMDYYIIDMKNVLVYDSGEIISIKSQKTLSKVAKLPEDISPGEYVLVVKSRYGTSIGFSTLLLNVVKKPVIVEKWRFKNFCYSLIGNCLDNSSCVTAIISITLVILAILLIYVIEVVKLSKLPKKKIEKALKHEERKKKTISLIKEILQEAEEQRQGREKEKTEEVERGKIIEDLLLKKRKTKPNLTEQKLFERETKQYMKDRKNVLKEKKEEFKRQKKIEKLLSSKR